MLHVMPIVFMTNSKKKTDNKFFNNKKEWRGNMLLGAFHANFFSNFYDKLFYVSS